MGTGQGQARDYSRRFSGRSGSLTCTFPSPYYHQAPQVRSEGWGTGELRFPGHRCGLERYKRISVNHKGKAWVPL